ncbi:MAG: hypothetical protein ACM3JB_11315 [Acidobacteriaceae bacterium]
MVTPIESGIDAAGSASEASSGTTGFTQVFDAVISNQQNEPTSINSRASVKTEGSRNNVRQKSEKEQDASEASAIPNAVPLLVTPTVPVATAQPQNGNDGLVTGPAVPCVAESQLAAPCRSDFAGSPKSDTEQVQSPKTGGAEVKADAASGTPATLPSGDFETTLHDNTAKPDSAHSENAGLTESSGAQRQPAPKVLAALAEKAESVIPLDTLDKPESHAGPVERSSGAPTPGMEQPRVSPRDARIKMKVIPKVQSSEVTPVLEQSNAIVAVESDSPGTKTLQGSTTLDVAPKNITVIQERTAEDRKSQVPASPSSDIARECPLEVAGDVQRTQSAAALHPGETAVARRQTPTKSPVPASDADQAVSNIGAAREKSISSISSVLTGHSPSSSGSAEPPVEVSANPSSPVSGPEPSTRVPEGFVPGGNHLLLRLERQEMRFGWNTPEFGHVEVRATVEHDRIGAVVDADSRLCDSMQSDLGSLRRALSNHSLELSYFQTSNSGSHGNAEQDRSREFRGDTRAANENFRPLPEKIHRTDSTVHSGALDLRA